MSACGWHHSVYTKCDNCRLQLSVKPASWQCSCNCLHNSAPGSRHMAHWEVPPPTRCPVKSMKRNPLSGWGPFCPAQKHNLIQQHNINFGSLAHEKACETLIHPNAQGALLTSHAFDGAPMVRPDHKAQRQSCMHNETMLLQLWQNSQQRPREKMQDEVKEEEHTLRRHASWQFF